MTAQRRWCMRAGLSAGSLACRLGQMQEFLNWRGGLDGAKLADEIRLMEHDARAVKLALRREVPEASEVEDAVKRVSKAMKPKGLALDDALKEAQKAVTLAQRTLKAAVTKAAKTKCSGAELPDEIETYFRASEFRAKEAGLAGRKR